MLTVNISIAGFNIGLLPCNGFHVCLEPSYLPFIYENQNAPADILISTFYGFPACAENPANMVFEAEDENKKFFSVYTENDQLIFRVYDQKDSGKLQQYAVLNPELDHWSIYLENAEEGKLFPLLYPMGPLIFYYLTVKFPAVMLHASGIDDRGRGRLFTGFSGSGKSTMAALWQQAECTIVNDDRLIVRKEGDDYYVYNTPMFYVDMPKKVRLSSMHLIKHHSENTLRKISGVPAVSRLMAFCIQHAYSRDILKKHLDFLSDLCENIPLYETGFIPDEKIVTFIRENEY